MKHTIMGFSQSDALRLGLGLDELAIMRWLVDFYPKMMKTEIDGAQYAWVNYAAISEDMPLLSIKKDTLYRKMQHMVDTGVLTHKTVKQGGTYAYYRFGTEYERLIAAERAFATGSDENPDGYGKKSVGGTEKNPEQIDPSTINNPSTKDQNTPAWFDQFWTQYPKKVGKPAALTAWRKLHVTALDIKPIMDGLAAQKRSEQWTKNGGQFIPHPSTWLNQRRWEGTQPDEPVKITNDEPRRSGFQRYGDGES